MALQPSAYLRIRNEVLPVSSVFDLSFRVVILHLLIFVCNEKLLTTTTTTTTATTTTTSNNNNNKSRVNGVYALFILPPYN